MRAILYPLVLLLFFSTGTFAQSQPQPMGWSTGSPVGFVFRISNNEAQKLLTKGTSDTLFRRLLHTQVDTFNIRSGWTRRPDRGHFIIARIVENELHCEYAGILPYQVFLLHEYNALTLQVVDNEGTVRSDAKVRLKFSEIPFDRETNTYRIDHTAFFGNRRFVSVDLDGFRSFFEVRKRERPYWAPSYYNDQGPQFYSYMVTDKNRYKPGDKVRFKSFALSEIRIPLQKPLEIWLAGNGKNTRVGTLEAHRPGSYAGEFSLSDSLNLALDKKYSISLRDRKSRIVASCTFEYEDYELRSETLQIKLSQTKHFFPAPNKLSIIARTRNNLPVMGARARIVVHTPILLESFQPLLYLPDTLLFTEKDLDAGGELTMDVPAGLFDHASVRYLVDVTVITMDNQQTTQTLDAEYYYRQQAIEVSLSNDSVRIDITHNGVPMRGVSGTVTYDDIKSVKVNLPFTEKINPTIKSLKVETASAKLSFEMESLMPKLDLVGGIQRDSFNLVLVNPHKLTVAWHIYRGDELIEKGSGTSFGHRSMITERSLTYYATLIFAFAGEERVMQRQYRFNDKALDVQLHINDRVFPGQTVAATITVSDQAGHPVGGVDLTAFGVSKDLNYYVPPLPDYGTLSRQRAESTTFDKKPANTRIARIPLDYRHWATRAGLDTMKYYQLLYPPGGKFVHKTPVTDSTQFAIYVMQKGMSKTVYVVEVDHKPVYYSWTTSGMAYANYAEPQKYHSVAVRLQHSVLTFDSLLFSPGHKTIISVDLDHLPDNITQLFLSRETIRKSTPVGSFTLLEQQRYLPFLTEISVSGNNSYLLQRDRFIPLSKKAGNVRCLAGPLDSGNYSLHNESGHSDFMIRGGNRYSVEDGVIYREKGVALMPRQLYESHQPPSSSIADVVVTKEEFMRDPSPIPEPWITQRITATSGNKSLSISLPKDNLQTGISAVLFQDPSTETTRSACLAGYNSGRYLLPIEINHLIVLYNDGTYFRMKNINFAVTGSIFVDFNNSIKHPQDSTSVKWRTASAEACFDTDPSRVITLRSITNRHYNYFGNVQGTVYDEEGDPMPGVNVVAKGSRFGAVTDVNGNFEFSMPSLYGTLVVSFIGYKTQELNLRAGTRAAIQMEADVTQLSEVVVTAYGAASRKDLVYSVSSLLQGRVAGVSVDQLDESSLIGAEGDADEAEQELYNQLLTVSRLRSNFTDVAFWEPKLYTDKRGQANFVVTFPDDITSWDAVVYAMNRRLQSGLARTSIRSFKPIMAQLEVPRFMVAGDSVNVLGSLANHTADGTITGRLEWRSSGVSTDSAVSFDRFTTHALRVVATDTDSVNIQYSFRRNDGYYDGEVRNIPVVSQGIIRANGTLSILGSEVKKITARGTHERTTVELLANSVDLWKHEAGSLIQYRYACNEQLASKLLGLIALKYFARYEESEFNYDATVNDIIRRLVKNQNAEFLWSWWNVSNQTSPWVSAHILRALKAASLAGFKVDLDVANIARKASFKFDLLESFSYDDADLLNALAAWDANLDYGRYVMRIDSLIRRQEVTESNYAKRSRYSYLREKMLLLEIRQMRRLPYKNELFTFTRRTGIKGEVFFADGLDANTWYRDEFSTNAIAYRMISRDSSLQHLKGPMQMYFLSQRARHAWNTYLAAGVLLSVLPDLITAGTTKKNQFSIRATTIANGDSTGNQHNIITQLPYKKILKPGEELLLRKLTGLPVFIMEYSNETVTAARSSGNGLSIATKLGDGTNQIQAGRPVKLLVDVKVSEDARAEYVMIEIPIPASCSYTDERKASYRNETHREYFKDRVNIYFEQMHSGNYQFEVELLPRFTGKFHLNPADVSLMYFPVVNANTDMKLVTVCDEQP